MSHSALYIFDNNNIKIKISNAIAWQFLRIDLSVYYRYYLLTNLLGEENA
jgi:hypothetical protein